MENNFFTFIEYQNITKNIKIVRKSNNLCNRNVII